ncbi:MAG: hypothetical protein H8E13_01875 [Actinobacteria bacterium]|nr:hypothetical protein [Actinomycetota bacterium]
MAKSQDWYKVSQGGGNLTVNTLSGGATCTATAFPDKIVVDFAASSDGDSARIDTPFGFKIVGGHVISANDVANATLQVRNTTTAVTDAVACAVDHTVTAFGTIDDGYDEFANGDNDLDILGASAGCTGTVVIEIVPN